MSVATVYMTEFSDEAALKEVAEYYQKTWEDSLSRGRSFDLCSSKPYVRHGHCNLAF